jgi:hypothetical protein
VVSLPKHFGFSLPETDHIEEGSTSDRQAATKNSPWNLKHKVNEILKNICEYGNLIDSYALMSYALEISSIKHRIRRL